MYSRELKIRRQGGLRRRHLILSFLAYSLKIDIPESFIVLLFITEVSTLISFEGDEALSRSLNDKFTNVCFRHHYIFAKTCCRMTMAITFSRQNDVGSRAFALFSIEKISFSFWSSS